MNLVRIRPHDPFAPTSLGEWPEHSRAGRVIRHGTRGRTVPVAGQDPTRRLTRPDQNGVTSHAAPAARIRVQNPRAWAGLVKPAVRTRHHTRPATVACARMS